MRDHHKLLWIAAGLALVGGIAFFSFGQSFFVEWAGTRGAPLNLVPPAPVESKLVFLGDIMLSRGIGAMAVKNSDFGYPARLIAADLAGADLIMANLENPVSTRGTKVGSIYSFRADPKMLETLKVLGVDLVTLANNHIWDYGSVAAKDTLENLAQEGLDFVGAGVDYTAAHRAVVRIVKDTKIAFLGYTNLIPAPVTTTESKPAVAFIDKSVLEQDINAIRAEADLVVVNFHWGNEYKVKHNDFQEQIAKDTLAAGADLIVGHHPHVPQELVEYDEGYVAYSLGNFIFDQNFSEDTRHGLALEVTVKDKKIVDAQTREVLFTKDFQPYFAAAESGQPEN